MTNISISKLKENPSKAIALADDYPVAILKRNKIEAYLIKKDFYEKMVDYFEDIIDARALQEYDPSEGILLEDALKELGL